MNLSNTEMIGYLASAILMLSFAMKNVRSLRMVNSLGCVCFVIYGFMLDTAWPVIITNGFILFLNLYYLFIKND